MGYQGMMMGGAVQGSLGDVGLAAPPADTTTTKSNAWPWVLGLAAVGGVVYLATRDGSMSNPSDYFIIETFDDASDRRSVREAKADARKLVEDGWEKRALVYTASDDPDRANERVFVYAVWRVGKDEIVETTEPAVVAAAYDVMYGRGGRSRENPANHYYIVDIGGDAFEESTKRAAIAAAKRLVKQDGHTKAIVFRSSFPGDQSEEEEAANDYVYGIWETYGIDRERRTFEESTDPAVLEKKQHEGRGTN